MLDADNCLGVADREAAAHALYEWWEGCGPEYIKKVWAWASMAHDESCSSYGVCVRCSFESTVAETERGVEMVISAFRGKHDDVA